MKIAVTGGAGFIGARVVALARRRGHQAWAFDRSRGEDVLGSLHELGDAEVVIHLAGMLGTSELFAWPEAAVEANVVGAVRMLNWCRDNGAGYVGITMPDSSWANVYQATKLCAMRLATAWHREFGVPVSHVRAFNAFGPGQKHGPGHPQKFIPTFATMAWEGKPLPIFGDGLQTVDMVYVDDVARMLLDAAAYGDDQIFDAGTGVGTTVRQVCGIVNRMCGRASDNVEYLPMRSGETEHTDIRARGAGWDLLGWKPELSNAQIEETVNWYRPE